jgi:hypothetical protein
MTVLTSLKALLFATPALTGVKGDVVPADGSADFAQMLNAVGTPTNPVAPMTPAKVTAPTPPVDTGADGYPTAADLPTELTSTQSFLRRPAGMEAFTPANAAPSLPPVDAIAPEPVPSPLQPVEPVDPSAVSIVVPIDDADAAPSPLSTASAVTPSVQTKAQSPVAIAQAEISSSPDDMAVAPDGLPSPMAPHPAMAAEAVVQAQAVSSPPAPIDAIAPGPVSVAVQTDEADAVTPTVAAEPAIVSNAQIFVQPPIAVAPAATALTPEMAITEEPTIASNAQIPAPSPITAPQAIIAPTGDTQVATEGASAPQPPVLPQLARAAERPSASPVANARPDQPQNVTATDAPADVAVPASQADAPATPVMATLAVPVSTPAAPAIDPIAVGIAAPAPMTSPMVRPQEALSDKPVMISATDLTPDKPIVDDPSMTDEAVPSAATADVPAPVSLAADPTMVVAPQLVASPVVPSPVAVTPESMQPDAVRPAANLRSPLRTSTATAGSGPAYQAMAALGDIAAMPVAETTARPAPVTVTLPVSPTVMADVTDNATPTPATPTAAPMPQPVAPMPAQPPIAPPVAIAPLMADVSVVPAPSALAADTSVEQTPNVPQIAVAAAPAQPVRAEAVSLLQLVRDHINLRGPRQTNDASPVANPVGEASTDVGPSILPPAVNDDLGPMAAPVQTIAPTITTTPAVPTVDLSASLGAQVVDMGVSGQWIDGLARDIAGLSANGAQGRFQINADQLGPIQVDIRQGEDGAAVSLTVATAAAERALRQESDGLKLDAGLAAVRISDVKIERAPHVAETTRSESNGNQTSSQQQSAGGSAQNQGQNMGQSSAQSHMQGRGQQRENNPFGHKAGTDAAVLNHRDTGDSADGSVRARYA